MTDRANPANPVAIPLEESIGAVFERRAREHPDRVAWVSAEGSITYGELNHRANQVAWALRKRAPDSDQRIGLCLPPGVVQATALLGILKAGLTAVVLDALGPPEGNRAILEDVEARALITDRGSASAIRALLPTGCELLNAEELSGTANHPNLDWSTPSMATACIVFTSGTTGRPKGVVRTHRNLVWVARAGAMEASEIQECRVCYVTGIHTGNGLTNLLRVLLMGGTALAFDLRTQGVDRLADWLTEQRATIFTAPASVFRQFLNGLNPDRRFPGVDIVRLSSEKVLKRDFEGFRRHFATSCLFINTISSTETGSFATLRLAHSADPEHPEGVIPARGTLPSAGGSPLPPPGGRRPANTPDFPSASVPIGRALPDVDLRLVDEHGEEVADGQPGEITVQSPGIAVGYWHQPELTARAFRPSTSAPDGIRYHTGDLAIRQPDGSLWYVGRRDSRVKIRGLGVHLQGVEAALGCHPEVRETAVMVRDQGQGAPWLVAFVVPATGKKPTPSDLRRHLRALLPEAAVPSVFEFLERLPLKSQGKIDRNALALRAVDRTRRDSAYVAPRTPVETVLADLWREVLRVDSVGIDDDFFNLGGDSLLATRLIVRIQDSFRVHLEVRALFEASTVAAQAILIPEVEKVTTMADLPALIPLPRGPLLPLSFAQERMWFLNQLEPDSTVYHLPRLLRLRGKLDPIALERALKEIVRRHEALRTLCVPLDGVPHGELLSPDRFHVGFEDLRALPDSDRDAEIQRRARDEMEAPFDLARDLMIRARVLQAADDEHFLVLTLHHIASDRWSAALFVREWSQLYAAFHQDQPSPLADLSIQYSDYAGWQRQWLQGEELERQLAYWKARLAGAPALLELPTDLPRPALLSQRGAQHRLSLGLALTDAVQTLARREGATPFMILLAAWQVLLSRLSGQDDILVGAPIAGRNQKATEGLIGFFVNTLVLRSDLSGNPTFQSLLAQVRETTLAAYQHSELPFEKLVQELRPERSLGHAPLFQVMFVLQNAPTSALELPGIQVDRLEMDRGTSMFDLTLSLSEHEGILGGSIEYCTDLFRPDTIDRWIGHFCRLLEGIVSDPDQPIAALPLMTDAERHQVLVDWNRTEADYPRDLCLHHLFEIQAEQNPDAIAVVDESESVTFSELNRRANQLAHHLLALGATADTLVGICLDRSVDMVTAVLGILKAGAAYLPLDLSYPVERLTFMLADARVPLLVTQGGLMGQLPPHSAGIIQVDRIPPECPAWNPEAPVRPGNLAYALYTSGSTGHPKGVLIEHRSAVNLITSIRRDPGFTRGDVLLAVTTLSFDIATAELFLPLCSGGRLVIAPRETATDGHRLAALIDACGATFMQPTPVSWRLLLDAGWQGCKRLRMVCTGEALPPDLAEQLLPLGAGLWNLYGPTETTIWSTGCQVIAAASPIPIGRPLANTRVYLLDSHLQPVPIGVVGELFLGGDGLARGYLGRPELTAERFIANPFSALDGTSRLYRTGDLARWSKAGSIECLGRLDGQVKLRGFRIELGEIEATLNRHPDVRRVAVALRPDAQGSPRLAAYFVPVSPTTPPSPNELRRHLRSTLPDHMIPTVFFILDILPLTPNGKVDRRALPATDVNRLANEASPLQPHGPAEELIAHIWTDVLGIPTPGVHDDFFSLGGHSLMAMRVIARIRQSLGIEISVRTLFEAPTVQALARWIAQESSDAGTVDPQPLRPIAREGFLPLSFTQERLWFVDQLEGSTTQYHLTQALRLRGTLDPRILEQTLREIVRRHESLRTTCKAVDGSPWADLLPADSFHLQVTQLSPTSEAELRGALLRLAADEARRPFHLSQDLMLRAHLFQIAPDDCLLCLTLHHIASDGWSLGIFARELPTLYSAFSEGRPSPLPELPVQFIDFAAWQRQWLQGEVLERQLTFWRTQLAGAPALLELPTDFPRPAVARHRGNRCRLHVGPDLTRSSHSLARREGATPFMVLLAAWQTLLARLSGQDDVTVGVPIAGRTRTEVEGLIGFFANTLVLRTRFHGNPTFRECLQRVRESTLAAYTHPDLPFEKLVEELRPERSLSHTPLFQVAFTFQNTPEETLALPGITLERVPVESLTSQFDLTLSLGERDGQLQGQLGYDSDLFEPETVDRWIGHFRCLLEGMVSNPDQPVADLPLMTEAERNQVLHEWSGSGAPAARRCSVPEVATPPPEGRRPTTFPGLPALFSAQVSRTPDAVALVCGDASLSYRELNAQALALAQILRSRGVVRGSAVALHLDRSLDFGVAVLAILHAGGCYVPLPLEYPPARLRFMLEDSRSTLVLSRGPLPAELCPTACEALDLERTGGPPIPPFVGHLDAAGMEEASTDPRIHAGSIHPDPESVDSWIRGCPPLSPQGADPAYVMYTSGSTGSPKGVVIPHRAVARLVLGQSFADFDPNLRTLLLAPLAFDASTFEFWAPLLHGGTCVVYPDRNVDPESLERVLRHGRVNCVFLTSALFNQLLDLRPSALESVAHLLTGGEVISLPHVLKARTLLPHTRLTHCYGPTECTTFATTHAIAPDEEFAHGSVSIGRPIGHTSAYVLDARRQPVPIGVPGELYLGGDGLALGYLGHPELTAERFVPDPFHPGTDSRLYRTGDRVRWSADGTLEFLGRYDDQVKIRGFRIEPTEIESTLRRHPSVREAWVVVRTGPDGAKRLAAWCQTAAGATETAADLRTFLRQSLPEYMIPAVTVSLERVPLTPNGKIDASALSVGSDERTSETASDPGTTTEALMSDLWCRLLGAKRVGLDENFFDLGGHSLLSLQLLEQIHRVFQTRLTPRAFFENPTVRSLSARVWDETVRPGRSRNHSPDQRLVALQSGGTQPPIFVFPGGYGDESELITPAWMSRRHLGPDQPLYALLSPGVDGSLPHHHTLAAEARDCLREMRRVHPHGPWFLIGMCVGGNLAYEVARQAQEAGEAVPMLALTDCSRPGRMGYLRSCLRDPRRGGRQFVMNWLYQSLPWARGLLTSTGRARQWERWFGTDSGTAAIPGVPDKQWEWRAYQHGEAVLSRQLSRPRGRFRGRIDLVTSQTMEQDPRVHLWQENATEGTQLLVLPGSHSTYLIEGAPLLANLFRRRSRP